MNKYALVLFLGIVMITSTISISFSEGILPEAESLSIIEDFDGTSDEFVPGQVVVGLEKPDPNFHASVVARGGQVINTIDQINAHVIKVPVNSEDVFISSISHNPNVKYAERDAIVTALFTPNDQYFGIQWGMKRIGMESVWENENDRQLGSGVIVAVVDTGIYDNHDDLVGTRILTDIDWDFVDDDNDTRPNKICRQFGQSSAEWHATFVAGIIGATKHNSIGVAGVGPVDILPVRTLNRCGSGSSSDVAAGILHAKNNGAHVINLSLGSSTASNSILDAVNLAYADDIILVAAAGNDGDESISYPAGFDSVISVSATTKFNDELASYSQFGNTIELSAPGGSSGSCNTSDASYIVSTGAIVSGRNVILTYLCAIGTSFASPHVAGVAALLKAQYMSDGTVSNVDIRTHLQTTAENLGDPGWDKKFGYGLVSADLAVSTPISGGGGGDITAPTLDSAATVTTTTIDVTFSEDLDGATVAGADFTVLGHTVSSATESSPGVVTITLSTMGTGETPLVTLVGSVSDVAGNAQTAGSATATDGIAPTITSITSDAITAGILKVGNTITFTATPASTELGGSVTGSYNAQVLTWSTANLGVTFTATYTVTEGEADQGTALQISGVTMDDAAGNTSAAQAGTDVVKLIDANSPVFSSITPSTGSTVASGFSVGYMLDEASSSGSITFERTGGSTDTSSHVYTMMSGDLTAAAHSISQSTLETDAGFAALVEGAIYSIDFSATDAALNTGTAQVTLITFDSTSPTTALSVTVTTAGSYLPKSFVDITVEVTSSSGFVSGASVSLKVTDPDGKVKTQSGTTDDTGTATFKYRISHKTSPGDYFVTATASAAGFDPGTGDTKFTV